MHVCEQKQDFLVLHNNLGPFILVIPLYYLRVDLHKKSYNFAIWHKEAVLQLFQIKQNISTIIRAIV